MENSWNRATQKTLENDQPNPQRGKKSRGSITKRPSRKKCDLVQIQTPLSVGEIIQ